MSDNPSQRLTVVYQAVEHLSAYPRNARTHSKRQIRQIAESIRMFGFSNPVLVDRNNRIVAGHGRVEAAKLLGVATIPTIRLESLTEDQIRAYILADNRIAQEAGWDRSILAIELQYLLTIEDDIDVTVTGFEVPEIDLILEEAKIIADKDDSFEISNEGRAVSRRGDLWTLGRHCIFCGNALEQSSYRALMAGRKAQIVFTDPPYNVAIQGHASGNGSIHHGDFAMACGEMSESQFIAFLTTSFDLMARHSTGGSIHYICMDWRHLAEILAAGKSIYDETLNLCVWAKNNAGMGSLYRSRHELIFVFRSGEGKHRNNIQLGRFGRNRSNVWEYANASTFSRTGDEGNLLALHPTVKPVALVADALLDASARGDTVLDLFLGSGSTVIAAERVGRACFGIELDPSYVDVAVRRWQSRTGDNAMQVSTGKTFNEISQSSEVSHG